MDCTRLRTGEAITIEEQVLADRERLLGSDHPNTLTAREVLSWWRSAEDGPAQPPR